MRLEMFWNGGFRSLWFSLIVLSSCKMDSCTVSSEGVLSLIPDSLQDEVTPLIDFLFHEIQDQYSVRLQLIDENGKKWPFHGNRDLTRDSLDRLLLKGWIMDIDTVMDGSIISDTFLADDIIRSLEIRDNYPWNHSIPDSIFRRYLLPYKVVHEYPEIWWSFFTPYYRDSLTSFAKQLESSIIDFSQPAWLHYYTVAEPGSLPMWWIYSENSSRFTKYPSLTEQKIFKEGDCYMEAINNVRILRTSGLPATIDEVPYWGSKNGSQASAVFWDYTISRFRAGIERAFFNREEARRPAKVVRYTFHRTGKYDQEIKPLLEGKDFPIQAMKNNYWLDATSDHIVVSDIKISLDSDGNQNNSLGYIYVLNYGQWEPVFYSNVHDDTLIFKDMGTDVIYRVGFRADDRDTFVTHPFLVDSLGSISYSEPDYSRTNDLMVHKINHGQEAYIAKGETYLLQYMDREGRWIDHQAKVCKEDGQLVYQDVPLGVFLILKSDMDKKHLARIFLTNGTGEQVWY